MALAKEVSPEHWIYYPTEGHWPGAYTHELTFRPDIKFLPQLALSLNTGISDEHDTSSLDGVEQRLEVSVLVPDASERRKYKDTPAVYKITYMNPGGLEGMQLTVHPTRSFQLATANGQLGSHDISISSQKMQADLLLASFVMGIRGRTSDPFVIRSIKNFGLVTERFIHNPCMRYDLEHMISPKLPKKIEWTPHGHPLFMDLVRWNGRIRVTMSLDDHQRIRSSHDVTVTLPSAVARISTDVCRNPFEIVIPEHAGLETDSNRADFHIGSWAPRLPAYAQETE